MDAKRTALLGILVALAVALNILESFVPSPLPWVRLGLANLMSLIAILVLGRRAGFLVTLLRVLVASLLLGGFMSPAFVLSLGGGLAGVAVMAIMAGGAWRLYSPLAMSVAGAFAHGLAQVLLLAWVLLRAREVLLLLPWVLLSAILSGVLTGLVANVVLVRRGGYLRAFGAGRARCPRDSSGWS